MKKEWLWGQSHKRKDQSPQTSLGFKGGASPQDSEFAYAQNDPDDSDLDLDNKCWNSKVSKI